MIYFGLDDIKSGLAYIVGLSAKYDIIVGTSKVGPSFKGIADVLPQNVKLVNMKYYKPNKDVAIQIDGNVKNMCLPVKVKILVDEDGSKSGYENTDIMVAHNYSEILDILNFYEKYDYETLEEV